MNNALSVVYNANRLLLHGRKGTCETNYALTVMLDERRLLLSNTMKRTSTNTVLRVSALTPQTE